jgi:hypothetical protein
MEDVDKEISEMKLSLNARARIVAESYLSTVRAPLISFVSRYLPFALSVWLNGIVRGVPSILCPESCRSSIPIQLLVRLERWTY